MNLMVNKLIESNSPYLLQHAHNPVNWYPWNDEAFERAKREDKPILLSIGYAACHWCHVMAHESFEDPDIARIMNEYFVNIKVDREERPDIDNIYMNSVVAMTGQGGWPTNVFLTPDGLPFFGGTYFPPVRRYDLPSFREVLLGIAKVWKDDRARIMESANQVKKYLASSFSSPVSKTLLGTEKLDQAAQILAQSYDWADGGWGNAPKFPQPLAIEFLLRRASRGDQLALDMAIHALKAMAKGGMYDVIGGGFARYSTDNRWLIPHFEKMLYDNALLSNAYLHAYLITGDGFFRKICEDTLNFIAREMTSPEGGFYSSIDADSEDGEGSYYLWSFDEIKDILGNSDDLDLFLTAYSVSDSGNFRGKNVLQRKLDDDVVARHFNIDEFQLRTRLDSIHTSLLMARDARVRPFVDDKVIVSWNALALLSFSEAGRCLGSGYSELAMRNFNFLETNLLNQNTLFRSWRAGIPSQPGFLEDYASLTLACLALYQTTYDVRFFIHANHLCEMMISKFCNADGEFYDVSEDQHDLILRPKEIQDNALPSGSAMASMALLYLSAYQGKHAWREIAEGMLASVQDFVVKYPLGFSYWLCAIDFALNPHFEIAILGDPSRQSFHKLIDVLWSEYRPNVIAAISTEPPAPGSPAILVDRKTVDSAPTAFLCQNFTCKLPVTEPSDFQAQLSGIRG